MAGTKGGSSKGTKRKTSSRKSGNGRRRTRAASDSSGDRVYTLSEVSRLTKISMPTLQRYKKSYQERIPSQGEGRRQRYPHEALEVFQEIKKENISRRGRPRKEGSQESKPRRGPGRPKGSGKKRSARKAPTESATSDSNLLTLTRVGELTGISYPTLVRYVKLHGDEIPYEGRGRKRRFHPEAVEVFRRLRAQSPKGRKKGSKAKPRATTSRAESGGDSSAMSSRLKALERSHARLEKQLDELVRALKKPVKISVHRL